MADYDDGWGRETALMPSNMLYVYRAEDTRAQHYASTPGAQPENRLFIHDTCDGQRRTYSPEHVNTLLTSDENPDGIKERIVQLIPRLSPAQQLLLATEISQPAIDAVKQINSTTVELLEAAKNFSVRKTEVTTTAPLRSR